MGFLNTCIFTSLAANVEKSVVTGWGVPVSFWMPTSRRDALPKGLLPVLGCNENLSSSCAYIRGVTHLTEIPPLSRVQRLATQHLKDFPTNKKRKRETKLFEKLESPTHGLSHKNVPFTEREYATQILSDEIFSSKHP